MATQKNGRVILVDAETAGVSVIGAGLIIDIESILLDPNGVDAVDAQIYAAQAVDATKLIFSGRVAGAGPSLSVSLMAGRPAGAPASQNGLFVVMTVAGVATAARLFIYLA